MRLACGLLALAINFGTCGVSFADPIAIDRRVIDFQLHDFRGATYDLATEKQPYVVVAFLGTECPLAKLYGPRLVELSREFEPQGVAFVGIDANEQDTLAEMGHYARTCKIEFPFLKDPSNQIADQFGAVRTPEVFVLNSERKVVYHGRIDDQFAVGSTRNTPQREDLRIGLKELLDQKPVSVPQTPATGCHIGRVNRRVPRGDITYSRDIAPLIQTHCANCHRAGEIGPFSLTSPEDVVNWSASIQEAIVEKRMPPWHADAHAGVFLNDRRLTVEDQAKIIAWIDNGMPIGDPQDLPPPAHFIDGWQIPQPELVLTMPQPFEVPASGTVEYQYFKFDQTFDEDKWVIASEARPGERAVVHHLILFYVPPNHRGRAEEASLKHSIATFAPGMPAWQARPGMARRIPAGSTLYLQAHYTPNGSVTVDRSQIGLVFADPKHVEKELLTDAVVNFRLNIPPNTDNVRLQAEESFDRHLQLISLLPHMHLRGKAFRIEATFPDKTESVLLNVPRYDFNWQNTYVFAQPVAMGPGSRLSCTAVYDNSAKNPANPDPSATVRWGDQTWEEMFVAQFEAVLNDQDLRLGRPVVQPHDGEAYEVIFRYQPRQPIKSVHVTGSFNDWKLTEQPLQGPDAAGVYEVRLRLKPGVYSYQFVLDGTILKADPGNPDLTENYTKSMLTIPGPVRSSAP